MLYNLFDPLETLLTHMFEASALALGGREVILLALETNLLKYDICCCHCE